MARRKKQDLPPMEVDLTPMIDVTFQLIIFFLLVSEITKLDAEKMALPVATQANKPPKGKGPRLVTINVVKKLGDTTEGVIKVQGNVMTPPELEDYLKVAALSEELVYDDEAKGMVSQIEILIRSDRSVQYKNILEIFERCTKQKIWKTSVATSMGKKET